MLWDSEVKKQNSNKPKKQELLSYTCKNVNGLKKKCAENVKEIGVYLVSLHHQPRNHLLTGLHKKCAMRFI